MKLSPEGDARLSRCGTTMPRMARICVFAGSNAGARPEYVHAATEFGSELARRKHAMVYGGASVGLMGACADAALAGGAEVVGVLPRALTSREVAHHNLTEMRIVSTLHERKAVMSALSDAVVALPGGCGTLDELFETITWCQLGVTEKAIGLLDVEGYWAPLLALLEHMNREGFVRPAVRIARASTAAELLDQLLTAPSAAAAG
jgi:uncharacterized protein (TIGR00730 family)